MVHILSFFMRKNAKNFLKTLKVETEVKNE